MVEVFSPSPELVANANVTAFMKEHGLGSLDELHEKAAADGDWYWTARANKLHWFKKWDQLMDDSKAPFYRWFTGGKINLSYNALDRHIEAGNGNRIAFIHESEDGEINRITYKELHRLTCKFANVLKGRGVKKGDRVTIYLPMVIEIAVAMLACARIGAPHSVVFSGFSAKALADRLIDAESTILITGDEAVRRGKHLGLKTKADEAASLAKVENMIVARRTGADVPWTEGRDHWWHDLMENASEECPAEELDAEDMLFLLYTSGTTGKPKGIMHTQGGYATGATTSLDFVFDLKPEKDIWWCAADCGWVTGHTYIVYGPLMLGVTSVMFEGTPDYPDAGRWWEIVEREKVSVLYTSPTAVRMHMGMGPQWAQKHDLSSLRLLGSVGEPINPAAWHWYHEFIGNKNCPIMDTWWQTETGGFMISPLPIDDLKPGSAVRPLPGYTGKVLDADGKEVEPGQQGFAVLTRPWPSMLRTIYKNEDRYRDVYWSQYEGIYFAGDSTTIDEDGYYWFLGRADEVMNVAGHRLGTTELENVLVAHDVVAEAAVIGIPDDVKGELPVAFVILMKGKDSPEDLNKQLVALVRDEIGPIATPKDIVIRQKLPKTRSGKIMRRLLKAEYLGQPLGDTSTLED